jgi:molecular chaperone DnaK
MSTINEVLVGIDFGTTNTVVTIYLTNKPIIMTDGLFKTIPSKICKSNGKIYCGNYIGLNSSNVIHSFKMEIGSDVKFDLDSGQVISNLDTFNSDNANNVTKLYTIEELLVYFFSHIRGLILKYLDTHFPTLSNVNIGAVITVPSNFNDHQRSIIKSAFEFANINVKRIINEPSAAALAYGLSTSSENSEYILVIDTGGGTMDFTVLIKTELFFEVAHSEGLNDLGGNNFTQLIVDDIIRVGKLSPIDLNSTILWNCAEKIKEKLSWTKQWDCEINSNGHKFNYKLSSNKFTGWALTLISKIEPILVQIIKQYPINWVILVGGSSRIPILQETIKQYTGIKPWVHPELEYVVAEGAGIYAGVIENKHSQSDSIVLLDVVPLSLGVEMADGSYSVIIPKNTPLPVKRTQKYTTDSPGCSTINIKVYQGERAIASKNILIYEIQWSKLSTGGVPIIEITFKIDLNSIINISILDKKTGVESTIIIPSGGTFDKNKLNSMIHNATSLADEDNAELQRKQHIYLIKNLISNGLANLSLNDLMDPDDKTTIINKFKIIENQIDTMDQLTLISTLNFMQSQHTLVQTDLSNGITHTELSPNNNFGSTDNNFGSTDNNFGSTDNNFGPTDNNFGSTDNNFGSTDNNFGSTDNNLLEKSLLIEKLTNQIKILLVKNPSWDQFLNPVLEELSYNSVSIQYINDKLELLKSIVDEQIDYKTQVTNLCLYLKNEIANGFINTNVEMLQGVINQTLILIDQNDPSTDWEEQINILNAKCEYIYNL